MATMYNGIDEKERERLRRLAQMRAGIEEKNEADKAMQAAAGEVAEGQPVSQEWNDLNKLDEAVDAGTFRQNAGNGQNAPAVLPEMKDEPDQAALIPNEQEETQVQAIAEEIKDEAESDEEAEEEALNGEETEEGQETPETEEKTGFEYNGQVYGDGELDLSHDPGEAVAVMHSGGMNALTEETIQAMDAWTEESDGIRAVLGILTDENMQEYAEIGENGELFEKNNRNAHSIFISNCCVLGPTLSKFAMKLNDPNFPPSLYGKAAGTVLTIVEMADANGEGYEEYIRNNMDSKEVAALTSAFGFYDDLFTEENGLDVVMQAAVKETQQRCCKGEGTDEDFALLEVQVPKLSMKERNADEVYGAYSDQIMNERMDADRYDVENNWYTEQTKRYMQLHGMGTDMYSAEATVAKDTIHAFRKDALDQVMDYATMLGYESLDEFMKEKGFDMEMIDELALYNFGLYEKEIVTNRGISALIEMITQGMADSGEQGKSDWNVEAFVKGLEAGVSGFASNRLESLYTWVQSTNIPVDSAQLRNQYTAKYGFFGGEKVLYNRLMSMCEAGFLPNESMNASVKQFLEAGGSPYQLGIDPDQLGWAAEESNNMEEFSEGLDEWAKGLDDSAQRAYKAGKWIGETAPGLLLESLIISPMLNGTGMSQACADILTPLLSSGKSWYNDGYTKAVDEGYGYGDRNGVAVSSLLGSWLGSCLTLDSDKMKAGCSAAISQLSIPDITTICGGIAELYKKIPETTKKAIGETAMLIAQNEMGDAMSDIGAFVIGGGTELILGDPSEDRLKPSDELVKFVQWMQLSQ